jgi:hypothetical protein
MNTPGLYQAIESIVIGGGKANESDAQLSRRIIAASYPRFDLFFCYAFQHSPEYSPSLSFLFWKVVKLPYSLFNYSMAVSMLIQRLETHLKVTDASDSMVVEIELDIYQKTIAKLKTML